jgi:glycosyltransferase involved in cell wall biosynthesis
MSRRVLLLSYYFPPAGGAGVQRALKFAKYLPSFDWTPVVLTVREGAYPARDASFWDDIPSSVSVHRTGSWDPYQLYARLTGQSRDDAVVHGSVDGEAHGWKTRLARWVRANLFLPDARVGWVPFAVHRGRQLVVQEDIDVILTTGPPHSTHLAGALLQWSTGVPWVADFRDPWTDINYYQELPHTALAKRVDAGLERMVLRRARAVTTVSPTWRDLLSSKIGGGARERDRFSVIQNGFDVEDLGGLSVSPHPSSDVFELIHVGSLYASRNPTALWRAIAQLRARQDASRLRIRLVGAVDSNVWHSLQEQGLVEITEHTSYVPHEEAMEEMRRAGLLILSIEQFPAAKGMMTTKIYEYLASGRPVVGIGPPEGDAAALLNTLNGGQVFHWSDQNGLETYLHTHVRAWARGEPLRGAASERVRPYRRQRQTERMATILTQILLKEEGTGRVCNEK